MNTENGLSRCDVFHDNASRPDLGRLTYANGPQDHRSRSDKRTGTYRWVAFAGISKTPASNGNMLHDRDIVTDLGCTPNDYPDGVWHTKPLSDFCLGIDIHATQQLVESIEQRMRQQLPGKTIHAQRVGDAKQHQGLDALRKQKGEQSLLGRSFP